jgi:hypothetical protein
MRRSNRKLHGSKTVSNFFELNLIEKSMNFIIVDINKKRCSGKRQFILPFALFRHRNMFLIKFDHLPLEVNLISNLFLSFLCNV